MPPCFNGMVKLHSITQVGAGMSVAFIKGSACKACKSRKAFVGWGSDLALW